MFNDAKEVFKENDGLRQNSHSSRKSILKNSFSLLCFLLCLSACSGENGSSSISESLSSGDFSTSESSYNHSDSSESSSDAQSSSEISESISSLEESSSETASESSVVISYESSSTEDTRTDLEKEFDQYPSDIKELFAESIGNRAIPYIAGSTYEGINTTYAQTEVLLTSLVVYGVKVTSFDDYGVSCEKHGFIIDSESDDKFNYAYLQGSDGVTLVVAYAYYNKAYPYFALYAYLY